MNHSGKFTRIVRKCVVVFLMWALFAPISSRAGSQNTDQPHLRVEIGYPSPTSPFTFGDVWEGVISTRVSWYPISIANVAAGPILRYSFFQINRTRIPFLATKIHLLQYGISLTHRISLFDAASITPILNAGHSWQRLSYEDLVRLNDAGWYVEPGILAGYDFSTSVELTLGVSLPQVQNKSFWSDEGKLIKAGIYSMGFVFTL